MWFRRRKKKGETEDKSTAALHDAQENLERIMERHTEVREVSTSLRWMRERNHFAETLQIIIEGGEL